MDPKTETEQCTHCGWVLGGRALSPLYLAPGTILTGKYLIGRTLGQGGFGITYLAFDLNLEIKLAIKEYLPINMATRAEGRSEVSILPGDSETRFIYGRAQFLDEARKLAQFEEHTGIVSIRDYFEANGTAYFVMNYVDGLSYKEFLKKKGGRVPLELALRIMIPVMKALEHVHKAGMLHRDVSPDNIYLARKGPVKLLDFGAARYAAGERSQNLSVILKPGYAPEEQYRAKGHQGSWTDVYATAATLYASLVGRPPTDALERLGEDHVARPSELGVDIPPQTEAALMKALALRAEKRFQTMEAFRLALTDRGGTTSQTPTISEPREVPVVELERVIPAEPEPMEITVEELERIPVSSTAPPLDPIHDQIDDRPTERPMDRPVERLDDRLVDRPVEQPVEPSPPPSQPLGRFAKKAQPPAKAELKPAPEAEPPTSPELVAPPARKKRLVTSLLIGVFLALAVFGAWTLSRPYVVRFFTTSIRHFPADDLAGVIEKGSVQFDSKVSADGRGALRIDSQKPNKLWLYQVDGLDIDNAAVLYRAKIKTQDFRGRVMLEMACRVAGRGEYFSRGVDRALTGTNDWTPLEIPFFLLKGQKLTTVNLWLALGGRGRVWIDDVQLLKRPLPGRKPWAEEGAPKGLEPDGARPPGPGGTNPGSAPPGSSRPGTDGRPPS
jgi:serine/threonine protein kinase